MLHSCKFNKQFFSPVKLAEGKDTLTLTRPGDTSLVIIQGENRQPHFPVKEGDSMTGYSIESMMFTSSNGNNINAWLIKPTDSLAGISLLHFHGNGGCMLLQYELMTPFIKHGFQVLMFDYSGFGYSEGKADRDNVYDDAHSALAFAKSLPEIANTPLIIYGQSLGGHLAAVVGTERQDEIDGMVIEGAFSSHDDVAAALSANIARIFVKDGYNGSESICNYHKPLLVIHSTEDGFIPIEMGKKIYHNANGPKEFFEIKHKHIQGPKYYSKEISEKIRKMIQQL